jgi:glycosyltransferase involved in cell wall biosynthesis
LQKKPLLTVICPVFNEQDCIELFYDRLKQVSRDLEPEMDCNLLFMNNCSTDSTLQKIKNLSAKDSTVYYATLASNVGYQRSIEKGIRIAKGDLFVIVDVDCEDPPEMFKDFYQKIKTGYDLVYGLRADREESWSLILIRKLFYRLTKSVSDEKFILDMAEFCMFTSEVRDALVQDSTSFPFIRASIGRIGYSTFGIPYKRHKRIAGKTNYNFYRMFTFAIAGILSSSTLPLRLTAYFLPIYFLACAVAFGFYNSGYFPGFFGFFQILTGIYLCTAISFISIYIARIHKNSLGRPNAFVANKHSRLP